MATPSRLPDPDTRRRVLAPGPGRDFYGWRIVGVTFVVNFMATGFFFYSFPVFFKAVAADLGSSRFGVSMGLAISNLVSAAVAPFVGRTVDRAPIRSIMLAGAASAALGFALLSRIESIWQFYAVLGTLLALGNALMGGIASSKLVSNWFVARRGTALGLATMGMSLSGMLMPPAATWLIGRFGWRGGFLAYAVCTLAVLVPAISLFVVNHPGEKGQRPDGRGPPPPSSGEATSPEDATWRTREILATRNFWVIGLSFALVLGALAAVLTHLVPYADDLGIPAYRAAWVLSACAGSGLVGKAVFGWLVDRFDARVALWLSFASQTAGLLILLSEPDYARLLLAGSIFGFGMGGLVPLHAAVAASAFGARSFGKVMGLLRPVEAPLHAAGVPFAGWVFDATGSYQLAFQLFVGVYALACLALLALDLKARGR